MTVPRPLSRRTWLRRMLVSVVSTPLVLGTAHAARTRRQEATPKPPALPSTWWNSLGMEFVLIPAGTFQMGSHKVNSEKPVHTVRISQPFYLGKTEVTQGQWQAVIGSNTSSFTGDANLPVESVSWEDVQEFLRRLEAREPGAGYRLPTEAEWEYAARAGSTTAYSFGDDTRQLGAYAWYADNAGGRTHPVGQKQPNAWGLYDMHGNVMERVQDWYGPYAAGAVVDPSGPASGAIRVNRGGSWLLPDMLCQSAFRYFLASGDRDPGLGLRLLRPVP